MAKRPTKTAVGSGELVKKRMPGATAIPARTDAGPALSDEMRNPAPQHGLTLKDAMSRHASREAVPTPPVALSGAQAPILPDPEPNVRRSGRALVPILADGTLYLPGTDNEMVPLTFEAYGELVAARLIEPVPWGSLKLASAVVELDGEGAEP